jgi:hypothetical protein
MVTSARKGPLLHCLEGLAQGRVWRPVCLPKRLLSSGVPGLLQVPFFEKASSKHIGPHEQQSRGSVRTRKIILSVQQDIHKGKNARKGVRVMAKKSASGGESSR